ncbi:phage antirepressor [Aeromonas veronii]|uniref:phage antirepressor n=1 Tax=Aeromonas veronii TaxID=654 RepID=UPI001117882F|nr:phage antirepressor [Aeromonas veronii]TNJ15814.1 phage antirepressor Ant [Aeromonas veronii]
MTNLISKAFEGHNIRIITDQQGEPWFVAADIAKVLEYTEASAMTRHLDDDEKGLSIVQTLGGSQEQITINESGLYSAILRSRKPEAKLFKRWVTFEVLPSIRKHGGYIAGQEQDAPELIMAKALMVAQSVIDRKSQELAAAQQIIAINAPKADFADRVAGDDKGVNIGNYARAVGLGQNVLFRALREHRILMTGGNRHNLPFQDYIERGYFTVKEGTRTHNDEIHPTFTPMVTGKGQQWLTKRLIDLGYLKPIAV